MGCSLIPGIIKNKNRACLSQKVSSTFRSDTEEILLSCQNSATALAEDSHSAKLSMHFHLASNTTTRAVAVFCESVRLHSFSIFKNPMTHNKFKNSLYLLFTLLYFAQGAITSYQMNFFKPHMYAEGIPTQQIATLASLVLLPFVIKIFFGMISDRVNFFGFGHRIPYMVTGVVLCTIAFVFVYFIEPSQNFTVFAAVILAAAFSMALFDTAADAYAVEVVESKHYVTVQSTMTAGRAAGFTLLSLAFGFIVIKFGYSSLFLLIAASLLVPLIMLLRMPEGAVVTKRKRFEWRAFSILLKPANFMLGVLLILAWFLFQGIAGTVTFYLSKELAATESILGNYGTINGIGMMIGAGIVLMLSRRYSLTFSVVCTLILVTLCGLAANVMSSLSVVPYIAALLGVTAGFHITLWMSVIMNCTDLRIAASTMAVFQMMANIGLAAGDGTATNLSSSIGFDNVFLSFALLNLILIPPAIFLIKRIQNTINR